ncbi:MAG TPA: O-antigen ligase family protein [Stellaceae bacterium]|jgi:O-antigen ligase|nr:O-antigen ligase family protein [Stellaceae bacterium]
MSGAFRLLERGATFAYLLLFAGIMWPPDAYFSGTMVTPQGQSNIYDFLEFATLMPFLALGFFARRRDLPWLVACAWPVLALALFGFLSAYWSDDPSLVVRRAGTVTLSTLFGIYLVARGDFAELVAMLVKVYAIAAIASFVAIVALPQAATVTGEYYTHAWRGAFTDKNELGMACGEAILLSVYAWRRGYGPRWLAIFVLAAFLVLLAGSQSKTPIVFMAAALYAATIVLALRRRSAAGLIFGYALVVFGLAGSAILAATWQDVLLALGRDPTFTNRTRIWQLALEYIAHRPWFGYGFGAFWREQSTDAQIFWVALGFKTPHAHNSWLEMALGIGIVGVGIAALSWLAAFYRTLRVAAAPHAVHVAFCLAFLAAIFFENLSEYEFFRSGRLMYALFIAILVYLGREVMLYRASHAAARRTIVAARPSRLVHAPAAAQ